MQPGAVQDITPTITYPLNQNHYSFNVQAYDVNLEIIDANSGTDLTLQTNTVIVGQHMNLRCQLSLTDQDMTNFPLANFQWTVPGYAISNYVTTINSGLFIPISHGKFQCTIFWVDSGIKQVQCSATVSGNPSTVRATFNASSPTATRTRLRTTNQPPISVGISGNIGDTVTFIPAAMILLLSHFGNCYCSNERCMCACLYRFSRSQQAYNRDNNIAEKLRRMGQICWTASGEFNMEERKQRETGGIRSCIQATHRSRGFMARNMLVSTTICKPIRRINMVETVEIVFG